VWLWQGPFNAKGRLTEFVKAAAAYVHLVEQELDVLGETRSRTRECGTHKRGLSLE
jgi:hypothetical protein